MSTKEIKDYYDSTENREARLDLLHAIHLIDGERIAIDCGCGAGSDIALLREKDFTVHAFDVEQESIERCAKRFKGDAKVKLYHDSFSTFEYPEASLAVADASLFFCPPSDFPNVWQSISKCLAPSKGIFCGSFLGPNDTMAGPNFDKDAFWPEVTIFTEENLRNIFVGFEIDKWTEHEVSGETAQGVPHHWHIFSVVAKRL